MPELCKARPAEGSEDSEQALPGRAREAQPRVRVALELVPRAYASPRWAWGLRRRRPKPAIRDNRETHHEDLRHRLQRPSDGDRDPDSEHLLGLGECLLAVASERTIVGVCSAFTR